MVFFVGWDGGLGVKILVPKGPGLSGNPHRMWDEEKKSKRSDVL